MSNPTSIYTQGWFLPGLDPSTPTSVFTEGWFEESILTAPNPPVLTATAVDQATVELTWEWVFLGVDVDSFKVEKRPTNPPLLEVDFVVVAEGLDPSARSYTDEDAWSLQAFDYRVSAINVIGESPSNIATATPPLPPFLNVGPPPGGGPAPVRTPVLQPSIFTLLSPGIYGIESR